MEGLSVHLFGGFLLERNSVAVPPIASRVGRSLFAYLVMNRDRPHQRDHLAGLFWPDLPESKARRRLSQTLWQIQDALHDGRSSYLIATTDTVAFDLTTKYWLDVEVFDRQFEVAESPDSAPSRASVDIAALRTCMDLYRGDFMAGFFEDWVIADQHHYRHRYLVAIRRLIDATKASGAYEEALRHARRLTHHDPLAEEVHQEVMRLCFLLGRSQEAIDHYERLRSILSEELGSQPTESTEELYRRIVRHRNAGIRPTRGEELTLPLNARVAAPFVGREEERRQLVDSMERVLAGSGGVVLVEGEPGVGKTRLVTEAADDAQWRGFQVSWGTCVEGTLRPFAPLAGVLESLSQLRIEQLSEQVASIWLKESLRLTTRFKGDSDSTESAELRPEEGSTRMREALINTLAALGTIGPHMVVIDDIQWADSDTLAVLSQLGPRLAESRIHLMLVYRSEEARGDPDLWDVLRDLDAVAGLRRVVLPSLSVFELDDMVKRLMGVAVLDSKVSSLLHRRTGGNALFTLETLLSLRDRGLFDGSDPADVLKDQLTEEVLPVAPRVMSVIDSRISLLSEPAGQVYEVLAVSGDAIDLGVLSEGSGLSRGIVVDAVDDLLHRGLIRDVGDGRFRVAHDHVRQVVYGRMEQHRRSLVHLRVAEALESAEQRDVEALAFHFMKGQDWQRGAPLVMEAGSRAAHLNALETARQHFQSARAASIKAGWEKTRRLDLLGELETVLGVLGRRSEQWDVIIEMESYADKDLAVRGETEKRKAWLHAHSSEFDQAVEAGQQSVRIEKEREDPTALAASLVALGTTHRWAGRPLEGVNYLREAVEVADRLSHERADAETELASTLVEIQDAEASIPHLGEALKSYVKHEDLRGMAEVAGIEARAHLQRGETEAARKAFERAIDVCRQIGYRHGEGVNLVNLSLLHQMQGRVADALPGYEDAGRIFEHLSNDRGKAMVLANAASARHNILGDDERAFTDATAALGMFEEIGDAARQAQCIEILAGIAARQGRQVEGLAMLENSMDMLADTGNRFLEAQHLRSLIELTLEMGDFSGVLSLIDSADELCSESQLDALAVEITSLRGVAMLAMGRAREASEYTGRAVIEITHGVERPYLVWHRHAWASWAIGEDEEATMATIRAREVLDDALGGLSDDELQHALEAVPENARIVEDASKLIAHTVQVELPIIGAPTGRSLGPEEVREVTWTLGHPFDERLESPQDRRKQRVLRLLEEASNGGVAPAVDHIATALGVSESTIRRDISALRAEGYHLVTRGNVQSEVS